MINNNNTETLSGVLASVFFEVRDQESFASMTSPRVMTTHLHKHRLPPNVWKKQVKIIVVLRNPKDVAVSFYNFMKGLKMFDYEGSFAGFFPTFMEGKSKSYRY